jgi:hypothetical protein
MFPECSLNVTKVVDVPAAIEDGKPPLKKKEILFYRLKLVCESTPSVCETAPSVCESTVSCRWWTFRRRL